MVMLYDSAARPTNQSPISIALATGATIPTAGLGISRVNPGAAVTAVVLQAGTAIGQQVVVINEAIAANTVTFDVVANSNVADGATTVIPGLRASTFVWAGTGRWYRSA